MTVTAYLQEQFEREVKRSRRALEMVPDGKHEWKPHERSMIFGYLANMVATIPTWVTMIINQDELDVAPVDGPKHVPVVMQTSGEYLAALDKSAAEARAALAATTDAHLATKWRLLARGHVVQHDTRQVTLQETLSHWSHHRGQMTVYLRLMGAKVPALFGPSADDQRFD